MNTFLKVSAAILGLIIIIIIGLNIYFTDERLREMIIPRVQEATGADVSAEELSLTFFKTFPRFGVEVGNLLIPDQEGDTLFSASELLVSVELFPLFRNELSISRLDVNRPAINYLVRADSTTNIDFLLEHGEEETESDEGFDISIPRFTLSEANILYTDLTNDSRFELNGLNADISLRYADLIESQVDAELESLNARISGTNFVENLSLSLNQTSAIDLENEILTLSDGTFRIRGLALNIAGSISSWSSDSPVANLQFSSSSDNFEELLRLAPPQFDETLAELESSGSLRLEGSVSGPIGGDELPAFNLIVEVNDGFLQNPDLPEAIRDIILNLEINNEIATIRELRATAAGNTLYATGTLERPLEEDAAFEFAINGDVDLSTVSNFYPIDGFGLEELSGLLRTDATANGRLDAPENATFSGEFLLQNGRLKYADVPRPIEDINARIDASGDRLLIRESGFRTSSGRLTLSGSIDNPLDETSRMVDVTAGLNFDLASIKEFYPIDEDTLAMRGELSANVTLRGRTDPDNLENLIQQGRVELRNGYISHRSIAKPLEEITFLAEAAGRRISIQNARFITGENSLSMSGSVTDYLSEVPSFDLTLDGNAVFSDITNYYSLEPWIQDIAGNAVMNLNASGTAGDPRNIALNGSLEVSGVSASGDSIPLPVTDLSGLLTIRPTVMTLERFGMNFGTTDIGLEGRLQRYMGYLEEAHNSEETMPRITGSYRSMHLNMDEIIDWDDESEDPIPIELPDFTASVSAQIDTLTIFGIRVTKISGTGGMNPEQITLNEAQATLFEGTATGTMEWKVPDPLQTTIRFSGDLENLRADAFFRDTGFLGEERNLHNHVTGGFNANVEYFAELNEDLSPDINTTDADGSFGMTRANLRGHPIQMKIAEFVRDPRLQSVNLDEWEADFAIRDTVLTLSNLTLTSDSIGIQMNGTQHLITNRIDYAATLLLPQSFKGAIASVISTPAANALQQENGRMTVPIRITGTTTSPQIRPDTRVIEEIIRERAREGAGNILRRLLNRN